MAEPETRTRNVRIIQGVVISTKMNKTVVVKVERKKRHPKYEKIIQRSKKFLVHDEKDELKVGDTISMREVRPLSKLKKFTLHEILEKAK